MKEPVFYNASHNPAVQYAESALKRRGFRFLQEPDEAVTHLLLGVPAFQSDGALRGGGQVSDILQMLSAQVVVCGGMLVDPALGAYHTVDLLEDPYYVSENARITAYCTIRLIMQQLPVILYECPVLIIGWGRIGKCLAKLLKNTGARVTVAARKEIDRATLSSLGYDTLDSRCLCNSLARFRVVVNTVPAPILSKEDTAECSQDCCLIDLASRLGIDDPRVIWARGLPGKDAPESSGELIASTLLRLL